MSRHSPDAPSAAAVPQSPRQSIAPGISDFAKIRRTGKYYVDKTRQLAALLEDDAGPLLLTRPRRFGKTLTLDTLRCFLELNYQDPGNAAVQQELFEGLAIMEDPALRECRERCMGQHPVIAVSFARVKGNDFHEALQRMCDVMSAEYSRHGRILRQQLPETPEERGRLLRYAEILAGEDERRQARIVPDVLSSMARWLHQVHGRPAFILIDEYDTALAKAWSAEREPPERSQARASGYYARMLTLMRGLLLPLLKPQPALQGSIARCILTGCTRISRESLFSGANNLIVLGLDDPPTADLMGFTEAEAADMLGYYGLADRLSAAKEWYDGYRFAGVQIYNPWSIAYYCRSLCRNPDSRPVNYWDDAGINDELTACLQALPEAGLEQLRQLYEGDKVSLELLDFFSYDELLRRPDSKALFALLYHTGFITHDDTGPEGSALPRWRIPNAEIRDCFERQILGFYRFEHTARISVSRELLTALLQGDALRAGDCLSWLFERFLSFNVFGPRSRLLEQVRAVINEHGSCQLRELFTHISPDQPERIYHMFVFGLLSGFEDKRLMLLPMELESGMGRCDLALRFSPSSRIPATLCIVEFKAAAGAGYQQLLAAARAGLDQIAERGYARGLAARHPGTGIIWAWGLGCQGKGCVAVCRRVGEEELPHLPG